MCYVCTRRTINDYLIIKLLDLNIHTPCMCFVLLLVRFNCAGIYLSVSVKASIRELYILLFDTHPVEYPSYSTVISLATCKEIFGQCTNTSRTHNKAI